MLSPGTIERNMQLYLEKMEEKHQQNAEKLVQLQKRIFSAVIRIQRGFRRFAMKRKTRAAIKIQRAFRQFWNKEEKKRQVLNRVKLSFCAYKIYYFLRQKCLGKGRNSPKEALKPLVKKRERMRIVNGIKHRCLKHLVTMSCFQSELFFVKKYRTYDRKTFVQQWSEFEKKLREWMWEQVRRKWVRKQGDLWINQQQKEINAVRYIDNLIEQYYNKHFQTFQRSQTSLVAGEAALSRQMSGVARSYLGSILFD